MTVCFFHRVADRDTVGAAHGGCASFDDLQFELSVSTSCGKFHDSARETFRLRAAQAAAAAAGLDRSGGSWRGTVHANAAHHHHDPMASAIA